MALQQFLVPQFIDVEDKIFGPITVRQFVIMIVALVLGAIEYQLFSFVYFIFAALITVGMAATLAFAKVNGRPVHFFMLNFAQTIKRPPVRIWNKEAYVYDVQVVKSEIVEKAKPFTPKKRPSGSKLQEISLIINTGGVYRTDEEGSTLIPEDNVQKNNTSVGNPML